MTRIAVIRPIRNLPTQAGQFTPVWMRSNGTTTGWWIWLNAGQPYAAVHGNVGQSLATFSGSPAVGKWSTICMTTASVGEGFGAVAGLNGSFSATGGSAGVTYSGGGTHAVGVNSATPTISASEVEIYALLGSDTARLDAAGYLAAHNAIITAIQQGRVLTGMFTGQTTLYDGRDAGEAVAGVWPDQLAGAASLTAFGAAERCFSPARFVA
jgi:hypothetical protein